METAWEVMEMKKGTGSQKEGVFRKVLHDEKLLTHVILVVIGIGGTVLFNALPIGSTMVRTLLVLVSSMVAIESGMNFSRRWMELNGTTNQK